MKNKELLYTIICIIIYLISTSIAFTNFGQNSIQSLIVTTLITIILFAIIVANKKTKYYGLVKVKNMKKYLYFIPLILLVSINFIGGINIKNTPQEILTYIPIALEIGFIEEMIFRGFLFKALEKENLNLAIIITTLTFGIGHLINLFNGAELIPTLIQVLYSTSVGYMFIKIFIKTKSLWPCIITHSLLNAFLIFASELTLILYISSILMLVISISYSYYLNKK